MFQEKEIVLLPFEGKAENCLVGYMDRSLLFIYKEDYIYTQEYLKSTMSSAYHLYILSDEKIEEGDWVYHAPTQNIIKATCNYTGNVRFKKIIATTNKTLEVGINQCDGCRAGKPVDHNGNHAMGEGRYPDYMCCKKDTYIHHLPEIDIDFIDEYIELYNTQNVVNKVLVEYVDNGEEGWVGDDYTGEPCWDEKIELYVNKNNTVNINFKKSSWTEKELPIDEMKNLIGLIDTPMGRRKYSSDVIDQIRKLKEWIDSNL